MTREELKEKQRIERDACLQDILKSPSKKKMIVAGPGTGKTFAFSRVLDSNGGANNIAMTFIKKLSDDMDHAFGNVAEVKTFHAYCKKILHEQNGRVDLVPYLTQVIEKDVEVLGEVYSEFDAKFQNLEEDSPAITFYLERGDYYEVVSFNDSVYRLYKALQADEDIVPEFDQILIDEFQDFNQLEVAFIGELEKKGPILIVGDDDQAIFDDRFASPDYLRERYESGEYKTFELPFCGRCPEVIVNATNAIITETQKLGGFDGRIPKRYECYIPDKESDSNRYPKIIAAHCTNAQTVANYVKKSIGIIDGDDIAESWVEGKEYPTVLIVGAKQYLTKIEKELNEDYPQLKYTKPGERGYGVVEGYKQLLTVQDSNLGWRILAEFFLSTEEFEVILTNSLDGTPIVQLLDDEFINAHRRVLEIIQLIKTGEELPKKLKIELKHIVDNCSKDILDWFSPVDEEEVVVDKTLPSILLTSFKGCKGLSAGHVFIVGANNGSIPVDPRGIKDVEIGQFIVALTRTRKQCHIIANKWLYSPKDDNGKWIPQFKRTVFLDFIPAELTNDLGELNAKKIEAI